MFNPNIFRFSLRNLCLKKLQYYETLTPKSLFSQERFDEISLFLQQNHLKINLVTKNLEIDSEAMKLENDEIFYLGKSKPDF